WHGPGSDRVGHGVHWVARQQFRSFILPRESSSAGPQTLQSIWNYARLQAHSWQRDRELLPINSRMSSVAKTLGSPYDTVSIWPQPLAHTLAKASGSTPSPRCAASGRLVFVSGVLGSRQEPGGIHFSCLLSVLTPPCFPSS